MWHGVETSEHGRHSFTVREADEGAFVTHLVAVVGCAEHRDAPAAYVSSGLMGVKRLGSRK